jgi:chromosome segregation ATPase
MSGASRPNTNERLVAVEAEIKNLCQRYDGFEGRMEEIFKDLRADLKELMRLYVCQQTLCATRGVINTQLQERAKDLEARMKKLEDLYPAIKTIIWIGVIIGGSIIAMIWALITGQAEIFFK